MVNPLHPPVALNEPSSARTRSEEEERNRESLVKDREDIPVGVDGLWESAAKYKVGNQEWVAETDKKTYELAVGLSVKWSEDQWEEVRQQEKEAARGHLNAPWTLKDLKKHVHEKKDHEDVLMRLNRLKNGEWEEDGSDPDKEKT